MFINYNKPVLITGGAGFVGSHIVEYLDLLGIGTTVIDNLATGNILNVNRFRSCNFVQQDICKRDRIEELIADSSLVLHLAAVVGMSNVVKNSSEVIKTNINGTEIIAKLCSKHGIPLVFVSSSAVYNPTSFENDSLYHEDSHLHIHGNHSASLYPETKLIGETICHDYGRKNGLKFMIIRPFNLIGPRQTSIYGMVVPNFVRCVLNSKPMQIYGDGLQTRTFSDISQAVKVLWQLIQETNWRGDVFNLATNDNPITVFELAKLIGDIISEKYEYEFVPYERIHGSGFTDVSSRRPSLSKLRQIVGEWNEVPLEESIKKIVKFEYDKGGLLQVSNSKNN